MSATITDHGTTDERADSSTPPPSTTVRLDLRGWSSPDTVVALAQEADRLVVGQQLDVITDEPSATAEFVRWLQGTDYELVEVRCLANRTTGFTFRRRAAG